MTSTWIQVAEKFPNLLVEIYGDLAKPGVKQVGTALEGILGLGNTILWPVHWANESSRIYLAKNLDNLRAKLENTPAEKIIPAAPEIGVPIAEKLTYVRDEKLADMYISLLAKASNVDTVSTAHPSFVNVINNLSPDEAKLLEIFLLTESIEYVTAKWEDGNSFRIANDLVTAEQQNSTPKILPFQKMYLRTSITLLD